MKQTRGLTSEAQRRMFSVKVAEGISLPVLQRPRMVKFNWSGVWKSDDYIVIMDRYKMRLRKRVSERERERERERDEVGYQWVVIWYCNTFSDISIWLIDLCHMQTLMSVVKSIYWYSIYNNPFLDLTEEVYIFQYLYCTLGLE